MAPSINQLPTQGASGGKNETPSLKDHYSALPNLVAAQHKASHDFRSDVVTTPTANMMQAILEATFADDVIDEDGDPSVRALEQRLVELTGKEAALWVLSGTMGNQICLRTHLAQPPHSVLLDHRAHIYGWESGALPVMSQASVTPVQPSNGIHLTLEDVKQHMIPEENFHYPPTRLVALENTLNGTIMPLEHAKEISDYVRSYPVPPGQKPVAIHLDGARIFDGVAGEGVDLKEYCACFDSISVCLAKGLGAPMGSIILGSKPFIARAKWFKKMFGGGTRQPGMMAAAALSALANSIPQLPRVHSLARATADRLSALGYKFSSPVQTNMVILDLEAAGIPVAAFVDYLTEVGVQVFPSPRLVFHYQTSEEAVEKLVDALGRLIQDKRAGKELVGRKMVGGYANGDTK
ncbi:conserved hypothetical protein [Uncinocarpus reesii 1704]|uniref:Aromatic amino acid beta-eliminating lyase/threonine aldolase domain-containing protein n=1 Tax=Uncinocarpus reesii (strain UAMH 1704) TaxID=336963 RepID=C4JJC7_UNCRE|nr:uncharacterized protein UREG_01734 [Uncinocarpus reesii 1704]EEP76885.1 conserved hypothetical protein [Uncinocarpus reesii 1704]